MASNQKDVDVTDSTGIKIVETAGSIITFVAGAFVAFGVEAFRRREDRKAEARGLRRARLVQPIEAFVDDQLELIAEAYWIATDSVLNSARNDQETKVRAGDEATAAVGEKLKRLRNREAAVAARVAALGNPKLSESFRQLSSQFINMRQAGVNSGFGAAREELNKAAQLGAEILEALWSEPLASAAHSSRRS